MSTLARKLPLARMRDTPDPPPELAPDSFASTLYVALAPLAEQDSDYGWSLLILLNAIGTMFQELDDVERDTVNGPGWSPLLDLNRCPDDALPWLAQFVGVRLLPGSTPDEQRARILATDGWRRGTPAAIEGAVKATLTGTQSVVMRERDPAGVDPPYCLTVHTLVSETPSSTATLNAILAQKPAGIVLTYAAVTGQDYAGLKSKQATYAAAKSAYRDYAAMRADF